MRPEVEMEVCVQPGLNHIHIIYISMQDKTKNVKGERRDGTYMNKCAVSFVFGTWRSSNARFSVSDFTAALLALYAAFPGGFVIPCFEPVLTITELFGIAERAGACSYSCSSLWGVRRIDRSVSVGLVGREFE